jgi:tRNA-dihydrouridine synthase B
MPLAIQLFGSEPDFMAEAARMIEACSYQGCTSDTPPAAIDINMGCPVPKIVGNGEGSALMKDPQLAGRIVRAVSDAVKLPVTVKIRAGWDAGSINAPEMAKILEDAGAAAITVHGRTRAQMYAPSSDPHVIAAVKKSVSIPVIGNGDIYTADDAMRMLDITECDGLMIARGALGNPWLFSEIRARMDGEFYKLPTLAERMETAIGQIGAMIEEKGERVALAEARKHLSWYIKGVDGAAAARMEINNARDFEAMKKIMRGLAR